MTTHARLRRVYAYTDREATILSGDPNPRLDDDRLTDAYGRLPFIVWDYANPDLDDDIAIDLDDEYPTIDAAATILAAVLLIAMFVLGYAIGAAL